MTTLMLVLLLGCSEKDPEGPAKITVDYSPVNLGVVGLPMDGEYHFDMQFTNTGGDLLEIGSVTVKGDYRCSFEFDGPDETDIATTESAFVRGYYAPRDPGEDQIAIHVTSNADDFPEFVVSICGSAVPEGQLDGATPPECEGPLPSAADCPDNAILF